MDISGRVISPKYQFDRAGCRTYFPGSQFIGVGLPIRGARGAQRADSQSQPCEERTMRVRNSLKSAKVRDKNCRVVRRKGRVYVINKKNPRLKTRQG